MNEPFVLEPKETLIIRLEQIVNRWSLKPLTRTPLVCTISLTFVKMWSMIDEDLGIIRVGSDIIWLQPKESRISLYLDESEEFEELRDIDV